MRSGTSSARISQGRRFVRCLAAALTSIMIMVPVEAAAAQHREGLNKQHGLVIVVEAVRPSWSANNHRRTPPLIAGSLSRIEVRHVAELVDRAGIGMLTTMTESGKHVSRPMALQEVEFDGDLGFFC